MKQDTEIQGKGLMMQRNSSQNLQQRRKNDIISAYGQREQFFKIFNPDMQIQVCRSAEECYFGGAPTLKELNNAYGKNTAAMWLIPQLANLSEFSGCKDKLTGNSMKMCASVIATEFCFLSVTELMLFFHRFKSGRYGKFYGNVDPLVITTSLRDFLEERQTAHIQRMREAQEKSEDSQTTLNYEEWQILKPFFNMGYEPWRIKKELAEARVKSNK